MADDDFDYVTPPPKVTATLECLPAGEIGKLRADNDRLRTVLEETRQFIVIVCGDQAPYVKAGLARIDAALQPLR